MLFFADSGEGAALQAMLMGSATTVIVLTLLAINALDNPYRDAMGQIKPVAMERTLRILDSARAVVNDTAHSPATPGALRSRPDGGREPDRFDRRFELAATVLLAMAAVATAWAAYQSARWHGEQARAQSASIAARVESTRAANVANRQTQIDVALFTQWVDAYARDETELADFYRSASAPSSSRRSRHGSRPSRGRIPRPAVAVRHAPVQARGHRPGRPPRGAGRGGLRARRAFIQRADNYSLAVVLFAASLFFAGISTRLTRSPGWPCSGSATPCSSAA